MDVPDTEYALSGDVHIAYQRFGQGPVDLVFVPGWASHIDYAWEDPAIRRFFERLGSFARVVWFDKRGTGLSDKVPDLPILEVRVDDVRAVMDAVGFDRAAIVGMNEGGPIGALFAAMYPQRTTALVLYGAFARRLWSEDYPFAPTLEQREEWIRSLKDGWGRGDEAKVLAPSRADDPEFLRWFKRYGRASVSPSAAEALARMNSDIDIRAILPSIRVPTLVLHRTGDRHVDVRNGRYLAGAIPGARFVELPGEDHLILAGDVGAVADEIEMFLTGHRAPTPIDRVLTTMLFTDIVGSTEAAARLGDRAWTDLLTEHDRIVRRELGRFGGREVNTMGDGFVATFDGPARAVRCAAAMREGLRAVRLRARFGVHTGECELRGKDIGGIGVHIAARVMALAAKDEILATSTVKDLTSGSGIRFSDRGVHSLKGVPEPWHLFEVTGS